MSLSVRIIVPIGVVALAGGITSAHAEEAVQALAVGTSPLVGETSAIVLGAGMEKQPRWLGSSQYKTQAIPYLDINWRDRVELSTTDGLTVDLIHKEPWHGGLVGTLAWGRSSKDLGVLANAVPTLDNTIQGGAYLEYNVGKIANLGVRWRHDVQQTGAAYADIYGELGLPAPGAMEHSIKLNFGLMNQSAMRRYFGVSQVSADTLHVGTYEPHAGLEQTTLTYQAFLPTSQTTGFVVGASWGALARHASNSPLVQNFGAKGQRNLMAAFTARF